MIVVSGGVVSHVNDRLAGEASVLLAASVARTSNVCAPSDSAPVVNGDEQDANAAASTRHSNVEPASVAVKENVGVLSLVGPDGPAVIVVSGGVVSIVAGVTVIGATPFAEMTVTPLPAAVTELV